MWYLENKILVAALIGCALAVAPLYWVLTRQRLGINISRDVAIFFVFWIVAFCGEFFLFGPYSFIEMTGEGNLAVSINHYLAGQPQGLRLAHEFGGGQDPYVMFGGMQYFQPEVLLASVLPTWLTILLHKVMIGALGFWGSYLLARGAVAGHRAAAVAVTSLFPFSHLYLLNYSTEFGTGFAAIPLCVYACIVKSRAKSFIWWVLGAALILAAAQPMKVFPAFLVAFVGAAILYENINIKRAAAAFLATVAASIINWHEVLYALYTMTGLTTRGSNAELDTHDISLALESGLWSIGLFGYATVALALALIVLAVRRHRDLGRSLGVLFWLYFSYVLALAFPWQSVGLAFINRLEHRYMLLALPVLMVPVAAKALAALGDRFSLGRFSFRPTVAVLAVGLAILAWNKSLNASIFLWFGGQSSFFGYESLKQPQWRPVEDFRVVSLFETPNANITTAFYGLDSFDAQLNLNFKPWAEYWRSIRHWSPKSENLTRLPIDRRMEKGKPFPFDEYARSDLLGIANVRFIFSPYPIRGDGLIQRQAPERMEEGPAWRPGTFGSQLAFVRYRLRRLFNPGTHYVYELSSVLPRVFAAERVKTIPDIVDARDRHDRVGAQAFARTALVSPSDADRLGKAGKILVTSSRKVENGYDISLSAPEGGVVLINTIPLPYWSAQADGKKVAAVPANGIHLAVKVPPKTKHLNVRYLRPLLRERIAGFLNLSR